MTGIILGPLAKLLDMCVHIYFSTNNFVIIPILNLLYNIKCNMYIITYYMYIIKYIINGNIICMIINYD